MKDMKFLIADENQSKRLQNVLFSLGYCWGDGDRTFQCTDRGALYAQRSDMCILQSSGEYFERTPNFTAMDTEEFIAAHNANSMQAGTSTGKVKSDGGSTDYYKLTIKTKNGSFECETGDVIAALVGDNFALGNATKALRRIWCDSIGSGKDGIDMHYDAKKINYFVADFIARQGR